MRVAGYFSGRARLCLKDKLSSIERHAEYLTIFVLIENKESVVSEVLEYKSWVCLICGWIYKEEDGLPEEGIAAGTRFAEIPDTWRWPLCDVGKDGFVAGGF